MEEANRWFTEIQEALAKGDHQHLIRLTKSGVRVFLFIRTLVDYVVALRLDKFTMDAAFFNLHRSARPCRNAHWIVEAPHTQP